MKLEITLDLESAIASALAPEKLGPILDKHVADAITTAVRDATGYRSAFSESLKDQLIAVLPHGLKVDDVAKFQQVLNQSLTGLVHGMNAETVSTALRKAAQQALPDLPAVLKLSELLEAAREGFHKDKHEAFFALWEPSDYGGGHLYLSSDESRRSTSFSSSRTDGKYKAEHHLAVTDSGEVYALRLDGRQVTPASRPDVISRFEAILMSMYVGRTRLDLDIDADEVECAAADQSD